MESNKNSKEELEIYRNSYRIKHMNSRLGPTEGPKYLENKRTNMKERYNFCSKRSKDWRTLSKDLDSNQEGSCSHWIDSVLNWQGW